jgi:hypothetical protein
LAHLAKTAKIAIVGEERMLAYEGRFKKRSGATYEYALDRRMPVAGTEPLDGGAHALRVVEVLEAAGHGATRRGRAA